MEEDGDDDYPRSPFWLQTTTNLRRVDLYRRRASSIFFNLGSLVLLLLVAAILFLVFVIPSLVRNSSHNSKPNLVKKSWDWINLVLVLFALAFGFLSRNRNQDRGYEGYRRIGSSSSDGAPKSNPSTPHQHWYDFSDQNVGGLRRNRISSSYPDLRELAVDGGDPWRFSDDTHLNSYRVWDSDHPYRRRSWKELDRQNSVTKDVHVDNLVNLPREVSYGPPPRSPSPPPLQPPSPPLPQPPVTTSAPPAAKRKTKRTYQSLGHDQEKMGRKGHASLEPKITVAEVPEEPPPAPPSPPPVMASIQEMEQRSSRSDRKRSGGNATKEFLTSFYNSKKKKKRQRQRSTDNLDALLHQPQQPPLRFQLPPPSPPPPPPPLPPPPSVFHNLFTSKKDKRKKNPPTTPATYSYTSPPPPPPPPPTAARPSRPITRKPQPTSQKLPMPAKTHNFNNIDDASSGGESPMRLIPPPPPLPPFKMPDLKYVVEGDYARLLSTDSSRSGSPEPDEVESPSSDGTQTPSPLFCPSPDVDTKADSFIAKFKAGLKLEKVNSFNQKQGLRMSNLGPNPGPGSSSQI